MKSILITGISGFVGTNLVSHFKSRSDVRVVGLGRKAVESVTMLSDSSTRSLDEFNVDTVIHLAGIAHDLSGKYKPEDYYKVNLEGTRKLVDEFVKSNATRFIFVSSIKAVCDITSTPADESIIPTPKTDYGKSKWMAEEYIQKVLNEHPEKHFFILRPSMMHGPGNKGNLNLLYRFARLGLPFPFGAYHNQRSFLSIDNFNFVRDSILDGRVKPGVYHLADDGFLSTAELYILICETLGSKGRTWNFPRQIINFAAGITGKRHMITKLTEDMEVSNRKIVNEIGAPLPISLKDGLKKTIASFHGK